MDYKLDMNVKKNLMTTVRKDAADWRKELERKSVDTGIFSRCDVGIAPDQKEQKEIAKNQHEVTEQQCNEQNRPKRILLLVGQVVLGTLSLFSSFGVFWNQISKRSKRRAEEERVENERKKREEIKRKKQEDKERKTLEREERAYRMNNVLQLCFAE